MKQHHKITITLIIVITQLFLITSQAKITKKTYKISHKIKKKVIKIAKKRNIPSLQLTISTGNDVLNFDYHHKQVKQQNIYGIGSASKFLSAIVIFKLIEDGKLQLNAKVIDYVTPTPQIKGFENLTIKNLLNHTSGLSDYTKNPDWMKSVTNNKAPKTYKEKVLLIDDTLKNSDVFSYSNSNYLFLQQVVEFITHKPYSIFFNEFYENYNLSNIKIGINENGLQAFFGQTDKASPEISSWREYYGFDAGVFTDTKTLNQLLTKLYREKSILKPSTLSQMEVWIEMQAMTIPIGNGISSEYGYGLMKLSYNDQEYIGHFGSTLKYQAMVFYNPAKNISISIVTNCSGRHLNNVFFQELIPAILDEL